MHGVYLATTYPEEGLSLALNSSPKNVKGHGGVFNGKAVQEAHTNHIQWPHKEYAQC